MKSIRNVYLAGQTTATAHGEITFDVDGVAVVADSVAQALSGVSHFDVIGDVEAVLPADEVEDASDEEEPVEENPAEEEPVEEDPAEEDPGEEESDEEESVEETRPASKATKGSKSKRSR